MPSYLSVFRAHLQSLGWPSHMLDSVMRHFNGDDIIGLGIRLALIGIMASAVRVLLMSLDTKIKESLFPTAFISVDDPAFDWIHTFLAQDPAVARQMKSFRLISSDERESQKADVYRHSKQAKKDGLALSKRDASWTTDSVVAQLLPVDGQSLRLMFDGKPIWVTRRSRGYARDPHSETQHLQIRCLVWHGEVMRDFILAAHKVFYHKDQGELMIHHASPYNGAWLTPITRPARAWTSVILPRLTKDDLLKDVQGFFSRMCRASCRMKRSSGTPREAFLTDEGPYLLHGPPGSGKTTLATAIASHLRLDLYCINPAARGMDDGKIHRMFRNVPSGSLILIEDIDCVLPARQRAKRDASSDDEDEEESTGGAAAQADPGKYGLAVSTVTLSGLLNAIDGVASQVSALSHGHGLFAKLLTSTFWEDSVLLASTNHPEKLDEALKRPGRFDVHVEFHNAVSSQIIDLYRHFYPLGEYAQPDSDAAAGTVKPTNLSEGFKDQAALDDHATQLSESIMNVGTEISMAALQGYLLRYKKDPKKAVCDAAVWVEGLKREQDEKIKKKEEKKREKEHRRLLVLPQTPNSEV